MSDKRKPQRAASEERKVQLPQFDRVAMVRAESFDADANTVEIVWTTGASVRRYDWWDGTEYEEVLSVDPKAVRLERLNLGAPFLDSHCSYSLDNVIGSVVPDTARLAGGKGTATIQLSKAPGVADTVQKIREGVIRNVSVGYWIHKVVKTEADDKTIARWDVVDWEPLEISAVPIPADPGSQIRSEQGDRDKGRALRSCVLVTSTSSISAPDKGRKEATMANRTAPKPAPTSPKGAAKRLADLEAENKRLAGLLAKRDGDKDEDEDKDERDADDTASETDDKSDDERDGGDDSDNKDDGDEEREGDDADEENAGDDADDKRAAPAARALTPAEVRKAAEEAVRKDRVRGAKIREIAAQFGFPKLGERHANGETSVRAFKDVVLERLAERQKKRGNTTFAAAGASEIDEKGGARATPAAARDFDKGAAAARALLGK